MAQLLKGEFDVDAPAGDDDPVTPNDDADLPKGICRAIYVGVAGNLSVTLARRSSPTLYQNLPVGIHPLRVRRVHATGTAAGGIVALY